MTFATWMWIIAQMTSTEWGILLGAVAVVAVPGVGALVAIFVQIKLLTYQVTKQNDAHKETQAEIRELWKAHNFQEGRLFKMDQVIAEMIRKLDIDPKSWTPKEKPQVRGNPG